MPILQMDNTRYREQQQGLAPNHPATPPDLALSPPQRAAAGRKAGALPPGSWAPAGTMRSRRRRREVGRAGRPGEVIFCCFPFLSPLPGPSAPFLIKKEIKLHAASANQPDRLPGCWMRAGQRGAGQDED